METGIRKTLEGYQVWFKIDNQTFHLDEHVEDTDKDSLEVAKFFERMLKVAFEKLNIPVVMQWVAVKDALPPVELDVLVWDEFNVYITNRLDSNYIVWDESTQILDEVTHWMYLPEPPCA